MNKKETTKAQLLIEKAVNMMLEDVGSMTYPQLVKHFQEGYEYFEKNKFNLGFEFFFGFFATTSGSGFSTIV